MRWRLILEEFSPELIYIKGSKNIVADALNHLDKIDVVLLFICLSVSLTNKLPLEYKDFDF